MGQREQDRLKVLHERRRDICCNTKQPGSGSGQFSGARSAALRRWRGRRPCGGRTPRGLRLAALAHYATKLYDVLPDLRANKSRHIRIYDTDSHAGDTIQRLFEASATYCARLNRQSLENSGADTGMAKSEPGAPLDARR